MLPPVKREFAIMFTLKIAVELKKDNGRPEYSKLRKELILRIQENGDGGRIRLGRPIEPAGYGDRQSPGS
jgi:hypothetical protein